MKATVLSLILISGLGLSARGDFTIVQKVEAKGHTNEMTLKLKDDKVRMEVAPQMTMIVDGRTGETITLLTAQIKFLRMSGD